MAHIRPDSTQKGKISYNAGIVSGIVSLAVSEVDGVELLNAKNKGINLEFECDFDDKLEIYADKSELKRVITNLCGNAVNYTNKDGHIKVILKAQSGDLIFSVEDNGNGIPQSDIPHLFMRFSQGTSRKRSTGTGLGLYLSRQIIEAHGGKIWVESKLNKGSEFTFLLTDVVRSSEERQVVNG